MKRRDYSKHYACHEKHVHDWPLYAKVWIWWGIQKWVPGVVVGHGRLRVRVRVTGRAQSGMDLSFVTARRKSKSVQRSPNNLRARKGSAFPPPKQQDETCLLLSRVAGGTTEAA